MEEIKIKHKQHYVFQAYLKNWATNDQIWCCRNKNNRFLTNTINIAQERNFYRVKDLNTDEEKFILMFLHNQPQEIIDIMRKHMEIYRKPLSWQQGVKGFNSAIKSTFYKNRPIPKNVNDAFIYVERFAEAAVNDMIEDIYCDEEGELITMLNLLTQGDVSFYYQPYHKPDMLFDDSKRAFLYYVCSQHFRTKAARSRLIEGLNDVIKDDMLKNFGINNNNLRPEHMTYHILWFIAGRVADVLYDKNAHLTLLHNKTDIPFITTDQPIINLMADYQDITDQASDILYYYPISSQLAITINDNNIDDEIVLTREEVDEYNKALISASYECVFSNSKEVFDQYFSTTQ